MEIYSLSAIVLGGLVLLFEAYKEYTNSDAVDNLKSNNQTSRKELENVRMTALTTKSENRRGLAIYILFFLGVYVAMLLSPEMAETFIGGGESAAKGGADISAQSLVNPDESVKALSDPGNLPFWLAVAITLGATSPTFQFMERKARAIAYFFAGVPRNIFRVLQSLEDLNYQQFGDGADLVLLQFFRQRLQEHPADPILQSTVKNIESSLRCIDLLQTPVIGPQSMVFRQLFQDETPLARIGDLRARYNQLLGKIRDLPVEAEPLQALQEETLKLADSMQCLFALYAIRSRRIPGALQGTPAALIIEKVTIEGTAQPLNDITLASVFGAVFSYLVVEKYALVVSTSTEVDATGAFTASLLVPLILSLILLAFLTILLRHLKIDQGSWPNDLGMQIPFWNYAKLAFWPAVFATVLYATVTCLGADGVMRYASEGDGEAMIKTALEFLKGEIQQLPRILFLSYVTAFGLLFVSDHHERMHWSATLGVALVVSAFLWMVATLAQSLFSVAPPAGLDTGAVAIMVTLPYSIFLILYSTAAEVAETASMKRFFSFVGVSFGGNQP